jgi:arylsulfatase
VRQGKWKLVWDRTVKHWELYDLEADRTETNDLAEAEPDRVRRMSEAWMRWAESIGVAPKEKKRKK